MLGLCWGQLASIILHPHREWSQRPPAAAAGRRGLPPFPPPTRLRNKEQWRTGVKWKQLLKMKDGSPHWDSTESCDGKKHTWSKLLPGCQKFRGRLDEVRGGFDCSVLPVCVILRYWCLYDAEAELITEKTQLRQQHLTFCIMKPVSPTLHSTTCTLAGFPSPCFYAHC